jgi:hypothetical protein
MQTYIGVDPALGRDQSACAVFKLGEDGKPELIGAASAMMRFIESDDEPPPELDGDTETDEDDDDFEDEDDED